MPLAASGHFLLYARAAEKSDGKPAITGGIFYRTAHGKSHLLARRDHVAAAWAWLSGSMAIYDANGDTNDMLSWRNLRTGAHGTTPVHPSLTGSGTSRNSTIVAAAPNGWIVQRYHRSRPTVLYLQTTTGNVTKFGAPEPPGRGSKALRVNTSSTALVVYNELEEDNNGSAVVMTFNKPGVFHRFIPINRSHVTACPAITAKYIACSVEGANVRNLLRLYTTNGHLATSTRPICDGVPSVMGSALAWLGTPPDCAKHTLFSLTRDDALHTARGPIDTAAISGLGGSIATRGRVVTNWDREILLVHGQSHERVLETAS